MRETVALRAAQEDQHAALSRSHEQLQRAEQRGHWAVSSGIPAPDSWSGPTATSACGGWCRAVSSRHGHLSRMVHPRTCRGERGDRGRLAGRSTDDASTGSAGPMAASTMCWRAAKYRAPCRRSAGRDDGDGPGRDRAGTAPQARLDEKQQLLAVMQQTTQLGFWFRRCDGDHHRRQSGLCASCSDVPRDKLLGASSCTSSIRSMPAGCGASLAGWPATRVAGADWSWRGPTAPCASAWATHTVHRRCGRRESLGLVVTAVRSERDRECRARPCMCPSSSSIRSGHGQRHRPATAATASSTTPGASAPARRASR